MPNAHRLCLGAAAALACGSGGVALATTNSYAINKIVVPKSVKGAPLGSQKTFKLTVTGVAKAKSSLWVFLAHKGCASSEAKESKRDGVFSPGYSYFAGPSNVDEFGVKGSFTRSPSAHPGSKVGRRYVCAYLTSTAIAAKTRAHASVAYQVTK